MNYMEFGKNNSRIIVLLHGGGLSWWNYREAVEMLKDEFRIIIPVLDGHAGSDRHFTTIKNNAEDIIAFINNNLGGSVFMMGGLSLGGQILLEILSRKSDICKYAIIESAMAVPSKLTNKLIGPALGCSYPLIRQKWFAKLQFRQLRIKENLFEDYYRDTCAVTKEDMIAFLRANTSYRISDKIRECSAVIHIYYGQKETKEIRRSAKVISDLLPSAKLIGLPGMYHADFSINHPADYVRAIKSLCEE